MSAAAATAAELAHDGTLIYHERQSGSLCGRHALNNLLQGSFFTEFDLADVANELDAAERSLMAPARGRAVESVNVDDAGNFSISVLRSAVGRTHGIGFESGRDVVDPAVADPERAGCTAFLLNLEEHWFAIRRLQTARGARWFNLNSTNAAPELISDFYLSTYLATMRASGYVAFVVTGALPTPPFDPSNARLYHRVSAIAAAAAAGGTAAGRAAAAARAQQEAADDPDFAAALAASVREAGRASGRGAAAGGGGGSGGGGGGDGGGAWEDAAVIGDSDDEDAELRAALAASLEAPPVRAAAAAAAPVSAIPAPAATHAAQASPHPSGAASWDAVALATAAAALRTRIPAEPPQGSPGAARLQLRLPAGAPPPVVGRDRASAAPPPPAALTRQRRFAGDAPVAAVFDWALLCWLEAFFPGLEGDAGAAAADALAPLEPVAFSLVTALPVKAWPRGGGDSGATVASAGWAPSASIQLRV